MRPEKYHYARKILENARQTPCAGSIFSQNADDAALNLYIVRGDDDRGHFGIRGLQANFAWAFTIEAFQRGFVAAHERDHDITRIGDLCLLADNEIAIHDADYKELAVWRDDAKRMQLAAGDLLDALTDLVERDRAEATSCGFSDDEMSWLEDARRAIAKAKGGAP